MKTKIPFIKLLSGVIAALFLSGCFLLYFPLLMLAPLQPFIMMAAKIAARYGPLLLLLVETNQPLPNQSQTMIAMQPAEINENTKLPGIEDQLIYEAENNKNLKSVIIVEINKISPEWLAEQIAEARRNNLSLRAVFVNSKKYGSSRKLSLNTISVLRNKNINICVTEGFAEKSVNKNFISKIIRFNNIKLPSGEQTAYACLMSAAPINL